MQNFSHRFSLAIAAGFAFLTPFLKAEPFPIFFGGVHPRPSPLGDEIAISYQGAICVIGLESRSEFVRLSEGSGWDIEPVWSPDGEQIAFLRTRNFHGGELKLIDAASGEELPLPKKVAGQGKLSFSPDGKKILGAFTGGRPAWFDLETGDVTPVPLGPVDDDEYRRKRIRFSLSANDRIVYVVHRDEPNEQGGNRGPQAEVWRCAKDGSNEEKLFEWPARIYDLECREDAAGFLAVTDLGTAHNDIWRIPFSDPLRNAKKLTQGQADEDRPSTIREGRLLVYSTNSLGATAIEITDRKINMNAPVFPGELRTSTSDATILVRCFDPVESETEPITARITIQRKDGKFHAPPGSLYRISNGQGHFYAAETDQITVPAGTYQVIARRGLEYRRSERTFTLDEENVEAVGLKLERWIHMAKRGWYSGENHVHANYGYGEWYNTPKTILRQCQGEDLNVCNTVVANSDGDAIFDREFFLGQVDPRSTDDCLIYWGQEFRSTIWGHMTLSNLTQLTEPIMTGFPGTTNPFDVPTNADIAQFTTDRGGLIGYTHPAGNMLDLYDQPYASKGLPVDAALKRVALMDVHGHTYDGSLQLWYRLMNCGLPVVASSGTDVFLNRVRSLPPGFARTYVHLPDGLTYSSWTEGQRDGRSFITNGPILSFEVNGELGMGARVSLESPGEVSVKAKAESQFPMDRVELVRNGEVVKTLDLSGDTLSAEFEGEIEIPESGWLALRAHGPAHPEVIKEPNAHTNPLWISVAGKPNPMAKTDAAFFLKWIDRLEKDVDARDRIPTEALKEHVQAQLDGAREYYRGLLKR